METVAQKEAILHQIAENIVNDISSDMGETIDGYDIYIEELRDRTIGDRRTYGVIDMGDLYTGVYVWDGRGWEYDSESPWDVKNRILAQRRYLRGV